MHLNTKTIITLIRDTHKQWSRDVCVCVCERPTFLWSCCNPELFSMIHTTKTYKEYTNKVNICVYMLSLYLPDYTHSSITDKSLAVQMDWADLPYSVSWGQTSLPLILTVISVSLYLFCFMSQTIMRIYFLEQQPALNWCFGMRDLSLFLRCCCYESQAAVELFITI